LDERIIAEVAVFAGKVIVKVEVVVLSLPKSSTATDLSSLELLYINAPRVVKLDDAHEILSKLMYAVPSEAFTVGATKVLPVAVYPVPVISSTAVYSVVFWLSVALAVYKAILNVSVVKLWIAS
jgi:hypothetical protein